MFLLEHYRRNQSKNHKHSRYQKRFYRRLSRLERRRHDRRIPRAALQDPHRSTWRKLYQSNSDQAMITFTGLDQKSFHDLLTAFEGFYKRYTPHSETGEIVPLSGKPQGRPRLMSAADCLAMYLSWTRLRGSNMVISLLFGMAGTSVSVYLRFSRDY